MVYFSILFNLFVFFMKLPTVKKKQNPFGVVYSWFLAKASSWILNYAKLYVLHD